jgi:hypothetical protein
VRKEVDAPHPPTSVPARARIGLEDNIDEAALPHITALI